MPGALPLILLVEDEPDLREVITDFLEEDGARFRIEIAGNYDDGVVLLNASQPALLIADVLLPGGGDGHQLAEAARRLGVATLLISGRPEVIVEQEARGVPFLAKPFRLPELQCVIRTLMEGEPPAAELGPAAHEREGYEAPRSETIPRCTPFGSRQPEPDLSRLNQWQTTSSFTRP